MIELFDYGEVALPPSDEVIYHEVEESLTAIDWRKRAAEHFRETKEGMPKINFGPVLGALYFALISEKNRRSRKAEINHWDSRLLLEHAGPDD